MSRTELKETAQKLIATLKSFNVDAKLINVSKGPTVTRFELKPGEGVKVSKIVNLSDDIALRLAASGVRIEAPIPNKEAIGIEIPNKTVDMVFIRDVIGSSEFEKFDSKLAFALGKDIAGKSIIADLGKMPHILIAGSTGSGKSVCINTLITSIIYKADPNEVKLLMVDPKVVELGVYNGIPHLLIPVVTDPRRASGALYWAVQEMLRRYAMFADANVRDIKGYNEKLTEEGNENTLPQIVIIIDELADLMMVAPGEVEDSICRLAQMARAAGMHLVIATQRPSVDVITGTIKANIPSRIAFAVSSQIDSRTILDQGGADKLLGKGDMLFSPIGSPKPIRLQGAFISDKEVERVVDFIKGKSEARYDEDIIEKIDNGKTVNINESSNDNGDDADELLPKALEIAVDTGKISASYIQRRLKVGFSRAARIIDQMEERGLIGPQDGSKPREVLITKEDYMEMSMRS
ncbi:MAG: DNA translocase FtsK, partial [Clostridia bacterium]|nr:DNA translocase FtsK [Clostridia bacterium]